MEQVSTRKTGGFFSSRKLITHCCLKGGSKDGQPLSALSLISFYIFNGDILPFAHFVHDPVVCLVLPDVLLDCFPFESGGTCMIVFLPPPAYSRICTSSLPAVYGQHRTSYFKCVFV